LYWFVWKESHWKKSHHCQLTGSSAPRIYGVARRMAAGPNFQRNSRSSHPIELGKEWSNKSWRDLLKISGCLLTPVENDERTHSLSESIKRKEHIHQHNRPPTSSIRKRYLCPLIIDNYTANNLTQSHRSKGKGANFVAPPKS